MPRDSMTLWIENAVWDTMWGVTFIYRGIVADLPIVHDMVAGVFCGAVAGIVAKTVVAPAERIKMSYQVTSEPFTYKGGFQRARSMVEKEGIRSLWRGHSTTILRIAPYAGFSYAFHDIAEITFKKAVGEPLPFTYKFLAGSIGGIGGTLLTYPLDVLRVRLALIPGSSFRSILSQGGLLHGLAPTLLGIIPYAGTTWCVKQTVQELYEDYFQRKLHGGMHLVTNAFAGLCGQLVTYPLDIIRRRMQMAINQKDPKLSGSVRYVFRTLIEKEGYKGLAKGFSINIVKGPVTLSISLTTYDILKGYLTSSPTNRGTSIGEG